MLCNDHDCPTSKPLEVVARPDESVDKMIRRFIKATRADGVLRESLIKSSFEKPSMRRRRKRKNSHSFSSKKDN